MSVKNALNEWISFDELDNLYLMKVHVDNDIVNINSNENHNFVDLYLKIYIHLSTDLI